MNSKHIKIDKVLPEQIFNFNYTVGIKLLIQ
jgi:hypothetical protein